MDTQILIQYGIVLISLIVLEGLLSADNAIVLAIMVRHLPPKQQKQALMYGLVGALVFRVIAIFLITILAKYWQIQVVGGLYLLYMSISHIKEFYAKLGKDEAEEEVAPKKQSGFWMTVLKVELTDIAFAVDSILAAVAIAITLPSITDVTIGGINAGPFAVMVLGGLAGVILMRFAANFFIKVLKTQPGLELAAFLIVGWVGIKLLVIAAEHEAIALLPHGFAHSAAWTATFWLVLFGLALFGFLYSKKLNEKMSK
ncbi:MAG: TerC family protein [Gemella sp.]|nr:TerC family protein [Gemella sp.]